MKLAAGHRNRTWRWPRQLSAIALLALGFALRLWWATTISPRQGADARMYTNVAIAIAAGEGYHREGIPTAYYPIGYPAALAGVDWLFGSQAVVARIANAVFALGTLWGLYIVASALTRSRCAATLALLLFAVYPADVGYTAVTLSQAFFNTLALLGSALCLSRRCPTTGQLVLGGVLLGCATLTRHQGIVVWLLIVGAWLFWLRGRRRWLQVLVVSLAFVAALTPWTIRNAVVMRGFVPISTNSGINLYIGNNPHANGRYKLTPDVDAALAAAIRGPRRGGHHEVRADRIARQLAFEYVSSQPRAALALWPSKFRSLYVDDNAFFAWSRKLPNPQQMLQLGRAKTLNAGFYPGLLVLGGLGLSIFALELCSRRRRNVRLSLPALVVMAFTLLHMLTFGDPSYHHPMMPWIAIYAGYALSAPWRYRDLPRRVLRALRGRSAPA